VISGLKVEPKEQEEHFFRSVPVGMHGSGGGSESKSKLIANPAYK
jgi:hypothetical protein